MPRVYKPIRLFVEEDGQRKPTLFFFIFFFWIFAALFMLAYTLFTEAAAQHAAAAYLSCTPAPTSTSTPTAISTSTPGITPTPSDTLTPTPFVYSDPATWELIEVAGDDGTITLELQDWQKAEIYHFFQEYYNLAWRSETGMPELEKVLEYLTGDFHDYVADELFPELFRRGYYFQYPQLENLQIEISPISGSDNEVNGFTVELSLTNPVNWKTVVRSIEDGVEINQRGYGPAVNTYRLVFRNTKWEIYLGRIALLKY